MGSLDVNVSPGAGGGGGLVGGSGDASLGGGSGDATTAAAGSGAPPAVGGALDPFTSTVQNLGTASAPPAPASTPDTFATGVAAGGGWGGSSGLAVPSGTAAGGGMGNQGQFGSDHGDGQPDPKNDPRLQGGYGALAQPGPLPGMANTAGPGDQFAPAPPVTNTQPPTDRAVDVNPVNPATSLPSTPGGSTPG